MSGKLTPTLLSPAAERIRNQIKEMIPETSAGDLGEQKSEKAERLETGSGGGVMYGGALLAKRISELVNQLGATDIGKNWKWTVAHFYEATEILNDSSKMYLIPLSENLTSTEEVLKEGHYAFIEYRPILSAGASVIFITPPA